MNPLADIRFEDGTVPRYEQLAEALRQRIADGRLVAGQRLPSTTQLRQLLGINVKTVQRGLAALSSEGLLERSPRRGTFIAPLQRQRTICLLIGKDLNQPDSPPFHSLVAHHLRTIARQHETQLALRVIPDDQLFDQAAVDLENDLQRGTFAAVLLLFSNPRLNAWVRQSCTVPHLPTRVDIDLEDLISRGLAHLAQQGYRRPLVIIGERHAGRGRALQTQTETRLDALGQGGGRCRVLAAVDDRSGYDLVHDTFARSRGDWPDALLLTNDDLARGVLQALAEREIRFPRDLGLITHANRGRHLLAPVALTRIEYDPRDFAERAWEATQALLEGNKPQRTPPHGRLIIGESCGESCGQSASSMPEPSCASATPFPASRHPAEHA